MLNMDAKYRLSIVCILSEPIGHSDHALKARVHARSQRHAHASACQNFTGVAEPTQTRHRKGHFCGLGNPQQATLCVARPTWRALRWMRSVVLPSPCDGVPGLSPTERRFRGVCVYYCRTYYATGTIYNTAGDQTDLFGSLPCLGPAVQLKKIALILVLGLL